MQEERHDCVVEIRLCFFSAKVGDYKVSLMALTMCRSTIRADHYNQAEMDYFAYPKGLQKIF